MFLFSLSIIIGCLFSLGVTKKSNVIVTIHRNDILSLFNEDEIWGIKFKNDTKDMVEVEVVIEETKLTEMKQLQNNKIFNIDIIYEDAMEAIRKEMERINNRTKWQSSMLPDIFFQEYRNWAEYVIFLDALLSRYPNIASQSFIGLTIEGRSIPVITLSEPGGQNDNKPGFYIQAEVHAREWLANAATMYILNALVEGYGNDERITNILNSINIYIAPTINIDGYMYSWIGENERMWRKNRRNNGDGTFGVDLNRNYDGPDGTWCTSGASSDTSSNTYCGPSPFSEPETMASISFLSNSAYNIGAAFDMHTTGLLILHPWAYTSTPLPPPYYDEFIILGAEQQAAIYDIHEVQYRSISASELYPASGTMIDYAFSQHGIVSFTYEGRGPGFNPPPDNIIPAGQEQLYGVITVAESLIDQKKK